MRQYTPEPDALAAALASRVDALERVAHGLQDDVAALGRGVAELTAQIRHLTLAGSGTRGPGSAAGRGPAEETDEAAATTQRDWLCVTDPALARQWLTELAEWIDAVGIRHGLAMPVPCWVLHADVVAELLALATERTAVYAGDRPTAVCEWHARWLPGAVERVTAALAACVADRGHRAAGRLYSTRDVDLSPATVANWWTTDRAVPPPVAFALTPLD